MKAILILAVINRVTAFWTALGASDSINGPEQVPVHSSVLDPVFSLVSWFWAEAKEPGSLDGPAHADFDQYLDYVVVEYKFEATEDRGAFENAAATLVADIWFVSERVGQLCISRGQLNNFEQLLPRSIRDSRSVHLMDVHRAVLTTYPLHSVSLPANDFAEFSEILRYTTEDALDIGYSWEGRPVRVLGAHSTPGVVDVFTGGRFYGPPPRTPGRTLIICGIHGREWASISTCLALLEDLPPNTAVVPVANPDGYEHTWSADRLWTKTLQPTSLVLCAGHNLARALDGYIDNKATPCSDEWTGQGTNMPLEARALRDYATQFDKVIEIHGSASGPAPETEIVSTISGPRTVIHLPDYGTGHLIPKKHLPELHQDMLAAIRNAMP